MSKGIEHICAQIEAEQKVAAEYAAKQNKSDNKPTNNPADEPSNNPADEPTNNITDEPLEDINEEVNE